MSQDKPWAQPMPEEQFDFMRAILAAPSPVGLEGAMTYGVLAPFFEEIGLEGWGIHRFRGNAGVVFDTHPGRDDLLTVMIVGHADKIRLQVRSISDDGKIWVNTDSFLPGVLIGHEVQLFSENPDQPGTYRVIDGGTIEALGAIHFADAKVRSGDAGIKKTQIYLELQLHGDKRKEQVQELGIKAGDPLLLKRPIRRGFAEDSFYGAYLDNGLGCFAAAEVARLVAAHGGLDKVRVLFAMSSHEEIGRHGSRVMAGELRPDVILAMDVNHDYAAAPGISDKRFPPLTMGKGFTFSAGAVASEYLNTLILQVAKQQDIPFQKDVTGRDTGTDAMAAVLAGIDAAVTSIGFPIRNMHTISETGHTGDVLAAIHMLYHLLVHMDEQGLTAEDFRSGHPRLDAAEPLTK